MPTRNVVLTEHLEEVIDRLVKTGRYQNASEVLRDGLRLVEQREAREAAKLVALKEATAIGFHNIEQGRFDDITEDGLEKFMSGLGQLASARAKKTGL
ncbi:type II toxin-antitoxin system ParD family antitoxin [Mesorhizobium sp. MSK_1335]|uniref:Type II toxin-antitoxin system ParD family antitoxin n=1 Tax=Mesorhizobium montanum TaxID=3072323 RepID=A0ABU4ZIR3_9HYPH|nr:type II toxin-antitoxin system ParD family antitoxin [Mesorhizobium sp. MSK_1335]MDX8524532.1 type II toxin-antitoxin system ParD family antitoxin [Mesorhizobium sp. MSK_1335]